MLQWNLFAITGNEDHGRYGDPGSSELESLRPREGVAAAHPTNQQHTSGIWNPLPTLLNQRKDPRLSRRTRSTTLLRTQPFRVRQMFCARSTCTSSNLKSWPSAVDKDSGGYRRGTCTCTPREPSPLTTSRQYSPETEPHSPSDAGCSYTQRPIPALQPAQSSSTCRTARPSDGSSSSCTAHPARLR